MHNLHNKKAQQIVESLMTYGWMILIMSAAIIIIFLFGIFSPSSFISPSPIISGFSGVEITTVVANYTYMEFYLTNALSVPVNMNKFLLTYNGTAYSDIKCQYLTLYPGQNSVCFLKVNLSNARDTVGLGMGFAVTSTINAFSNGTMSFVPANIMLPLPSSITTFSEEALPAGIPWWVVFDGINHSSSASSISFSTVAGNYSFTAGNATSAGCVYSPLPSSGYLEAGLVQQVIFINSCAATFIEKELPSGTNWQATYAGVSNSTTTNVLVFTNQRTGTHAFSVSNSVVGGCIYYPSPSSGQLAVGSYKYIRFLGECTTTFTESGLPSGYTWYAVFDGLTETNSSPNSIYYLGAPGYFPYSIRTLSNTSSSLACTTTYTPTPASSNSLAAGSTVSISFSASTACLTTFKESGLPSGYTWYVTYGAVTNNSNAPSNIVFNTKTSGSGIPSYAYSVKTLSNTSSSLACTTTYTPTPASSNSLAAGSTVSISFSASTACLTTFTESGLSAGIVWTVTYGGVTNSSTAPSNVIFHTLTSGSGIPSYSYTINSISPNSSATLDCTTAETPSSSSGTAEAGSTVSVTFSEETTCITKFDESNLPSSFPWNVTFNNVEKTSTATEIQFTTVTSGGNIPSYSFSVPTLSSTSVEWNFGTSSYQGSIYQGMPTQAFPSAVSDLNNNNVACSSPYDSQGYTAVAYMYFTSSITVTITTDDAMEVFYAPEGTSSWSSVFGGNAWHGQGATQYGPTTISVTPGWYEVAVDWTNTCTPGMSAFEINGAYMLSSQFNVIAWTPSSSSTDLLPYSDVTANPADPSGITVEQTGSWAHEFNGYFQYTYTPSPSSGTVSAGSTNSISYSTSGTANTEFYGINLPSSASSWSVSYDGASGSASTGSPITLSQGGQSSPGTYTATATAAVSDGLTCTASASVLQGTTYTFTNWMCQVPLSVNNLASSSTPSPFQEGVYVDTNTYSAYLNSNSNMQNVEFTYSNGAVIPSWYEGTYTNSIDSVNQPDALFWLNLNGIGGSSSETIYLNFAYPLSNNLFNANTVGEAPQLSSSYGQYDNGGTVFTQYGGGGSTGWSKFTFIGGSWTTSNGYLQQTSTSGTYSGGPAALIEGTSYPANGNYILSAAFSYTTEANARVGLMAVTTPVSGDADGYRFIGQQGSGGAGFLSFLNDLVAWVVNNGYQGAVSTAYSMTVIDNGGTWSGNLHSGYSGGSATILTSLSPTGYTTANKQGATSGYVGISAAYCGSTCTTSNPMNIEWFNMRTYSPNGISSPSFSNPGGISSGYSYSSINYLAGSLAAGFSTYSNPSAPSCNGYELASTSSSVQLNGQCNWGGGYMNVYYAGGNAGYVNFNFYGASDGQVYADGSSDDRCLDTTGGSSEILNLYVPAQTINVHVGLGSGGGSCSNGGVLIN